MVALAICAAVIVALAISAAWIEPDANTAFAAVMLPAWMFVPTMLFAAIFPATTELAASDTDVIAPACTLGVEIALSAILVLVTAPAARMSAVTAATAN